MRDEAPWIDLEQYGFNRRFASLAAPAIDRPMPGHGERYEVGIRVSGTPLVRSGKMPPRIRFAARQVGPDRASEHVAPKAAEVCAALYGLRWH